MTSSRRDDAASAHDESVRRYFSRPDEYLAKDFGVRIRAEIVGDALRDVPACGVLDVGCGDGRVSLPLLSRGHHVSFLDSSPAMLIRARRHAAAHTDRCEFIEGSIDQLPPLRRFGIVICTGVMAHVDSTREMLAAIARRAAPGARVLVQITDAGSWIGALSGRYLAWRERRYPAYGYNIKPLTLSELVSEASGVGLEARTVFRYSLTLPGMIRLLPNWLLYKLTSLSRRRPFNRIGGEVIVFFVKS